MEQDIAQFEELGAAFRTALTVCAGDRCIHRRYITRDGRDVTTGFRTEISGDGWSAAFFFWHYPQGLAGVYNLLECRIHFPTVPDMVFPLYNIVHETAPEDFRFCAMNWISTVSQMQSAVSWLWLCLQVRWADCTALAQSPDALDRLVQRQKAEIVRFYRRDIFAGSPSQKTLHRQLRGWYFASLLRLTGDSAALILSGDRPRAVKRLRRGRPTCDYQLALANRLADQSRGLPDLLPSELEEMMMHRTPPSDSLSAQDGGSSEGAPAVPLKPTQMLGTVLLGTLILLPFWTVFYMLLFTMEVEYAARGITALLGIDWTEVLFCGWLTAFLCAYPILPRVLTLQFRHRPDILRERLKQFQMFGTAAVQRTIRALTWLAVTGFTLHLGFYAYSGLAFCQRGFYDRAGAFSLQGEYHAYSKVLRVTHSTQPGTLFGLVNWTQEDYVILLSDGTRLYVGADYGISTQQFETNALPLLEDAGVTITDFTED